MGSWWNKNDRLLEDSVVLSNPDTVVFLTFDPNPYHYYSLVPYGNIDLQYKGEKIRFLLEMGVNTAVTKAYKSGTTTDKILQRERYFVSLRNFLMEVYFNDYISLRIGQDFTPIDFIETSNQMFYDNNCFLNSGSLYEGRKPLIEFIAGNFKQAPKVGFETKLAMIRVDSASVQYHQEFYPLTNSKIPKLEVSAECRINSGNFGFGIKGVAGYQQYELVLPENFNPDKQWTDPIHCYAFGGHIGLKLGSVYLNSDIGGGQNLGAYGIYISNPFVDHGASNADIVDIFYPVFAGTGLSDSVNNLTRDNSKALEWNAILGFKPTSRLSFEAGVGFVHASRDSVTSLKWHDQWAGYIQSGISIFEYLTITPELGLYYFGPYRNYGRLMYAGFGISVDF